jgi:hypothetical protein
VRALATSVHACGFQPLSACMPSSLQVRRTETSVASSASRQTTFSPFLAVVLGAVGASDIERDRQGTEDEGKREREREQKCGYYNKHVISYDMTPPQGHPNNPMAMECSRKSSRSHTGSFWLDTAAQPRHPIRALDLESVETTV